MEYIAWINAVNLNKINNQEIRILHRYTNFVILINKHIYNYRKF